MSGVWCNAPGLSRHTKRWDRREGQAPLKTVGRGQEFVADLNGRQKAAHAWLAPAVPNRLTASGSRAQPWSRHRRRYTTFAKSRRRGRNAPCAPPLKGRQAYERHYIDRAVRCGYFTAILHLAVAAAPLRALYARCRRCRGLPAR